MFFLLWVGLISIVTFSWAQCTLSASGGDDSPAFLDAMLGSDCDVVTIPVGTTLSIQTRMNMTGVSNKKLLLEGTVQFDPDIPYWTGNAFFFEFQTQVTFWLLGGENIVVTGGGTLDGAGEDWYSAFSSNSSLLRPIIMTIYEGTNVLIDGISMINSPEWFNLVYGSNNVTYNNITITAPTSSSNTDGWDIYRSDTVSIINSVIVNGDDCVSFKPNSTNIIVDNLNCTGSHGISVGSLGEYAGEYDIVENVIASNVRMSNAENGARIKAFAGDGVGSGSVKNITFQNFIMSEVDNPVVIDQCYETSDADCEEFPSNTYISDVIFNGMSGTSSGSTVASLDCSPDGRCSGVTVEVFSLAPSGGGTAKYECQNVDLTGDAATLFGECDAT